MKTLNNGNFKIAISSLRTTKWRNLLTMLGIIIGVVSVVTIVSVGEGIKHQIVSQINRLGKDLITVRPGNLGSQGTNGLLNSLNELGASNQSSPLTEHDLSVVSSTPNIKEAVPLSIIPGSVQQGSKTQSNSIVIGSDNGIPDVLNQTLEYGEFFTSNTQDVDQAVIGQGVASQLFPGEVPLGRTISFQGQQLIIVGVLNQFDFVPLSLDSDFNNAVFVPITFAEQLENNNIPIYEILVKPSNTGSTDKVVNDINQELLKAHSGVKNFSVYKQSQSLAISNSILTLMTSLISGIAAISLFVGGIGIMNIMFVAVTERTHEIGIRKAIGATNSQILGQFLIEAAILSLVGGILGIIISLIINVALRILTNLQPLISWEVVLLATGVSLAVGVVFGIVPAFKAAHKDAINALRYQ